jgi:hypothetical protein
MMFRAVFWVILPCKMIVDRRFRGAIPDDGGSTHLGSITQKTALNITTRNYTGIHQTRNEYKQRCVEHLWRMQNDRLPKQAFKYPRVQTGPGRPRNRCKLQNDGAGTSGPTPRNQKTEDDMIKTKSKCAAYIRVVT